MSGESGAAPWAPLASGKTAGRARAAVDAIAHDLAVAAEPGLEPSLGWGEAGLALFFAYLGREPGRQGSAERAWQHLDRAVAALAQEPAAAAGLYRGFAGVAWVAEHLAGGAEDGPEDDSEDDPNAEIDRTLLSLLARSPWRGEIDLLGGLVGWGVYALERLPRASAAAMLRLLLARLGECAEQRAEGLVWRAPGGPELAAGPGMAHGVAGVIALLARVVGAGVESGAAGSLLAAAVNGALARGSGEEDKDLAWCAGDAGLSAALLAAGRALGCPGWQREALRLAGAAAHRDLECPDSGLCHGTAGLCHLFHRLYRETGEPLFHAAAHRWLERTLAARRPGQGIGGYLRPARPADRPRRWLPDPGFLGGAAGTGLALLGAVSDIEPAWDRLLLLSSF